jgi:uronate dehydrogenase
MVRCELAGFGAVRVKVQGCDGILHLGGVSVEDTSDNFQRSNIFGVYNVHEAARQAGVRHFGHSGPGEG